MPLKYMFAVRISAARDIRLALRDRLYERCVRRAERLDALRGIDVANHGLLDLGDLTTRDAQPQGD